MIEKHLSLLACPKCGGDLACRVLEGSADWIACGTLECGGCRAVYPILKEVAILLPPDRLGDFVSEEEKITLQNFMSLSASGAGSSQSLDNARNWAFQFGEEFRVNEEMLQDDDSLWGRNSFNQYAGLEPESSSGRTVLTAGGGSGREAWHILRAGVNLCIVADIGSHLYLLNELLKDRRDRVLLVRCDALALPLKDRTLDVTICDHALQHFPDSRRAYGELCRVTKGGGLVSVCVYSHENNFLMTGIVEPSKRASAPAASESLKPPGNLFRHASVCALSDRGPPGLLVQEVLP